MRTWQPVSGCAERPEGADLHDQGKELLVLQVSYKAMCRSLRGWYRSLKATGFQVTEPVFNMPICAAPKVVYLVRRRHSC